MPDDAATTELEATTRDWIDGDPEPADRAELETLLAARRHDELAERMAGILEFGTAGIRGVMEAGSARMNRAVVIRTTKGLADYLVSADLAAGPVLVGFDGRRNSRRFAEDTAGVLAAAGIPVRYFPDVVPTPIVGFATSVLGATAAVVITASHNPPEYNGYKVYAANHAQIVPPVDRHIADAIAAGPPAVKVDRIEHGFDGASELISPVPDGIFEAYLDAVAATRPVVDRDQSLSIVYTPLHGVGGSYVEATLRHFGYEIFTVPEQGEPDGDFPTVDFPNPEEPGALDLAIAHATQRHADLVIANDPDADRLAVALPGPGGWSLLSGNQIGLLLADYLLPHAKPDPSPLIITSVVSTPGIGPVAAAYGAHWEETLTGFKWIAAAGLELEARGAGRFVLGFEEALGYSVGRVVRDKDGIAAALAFCDLAAHAGHSGATVRDRLDDLYRRFGVFASAQHSAVRPGTEGAEEIAAAMRRLRADLPTAVGGNAVRRVTDYASGEEERPAWMPNTNLVALELEDDARILVRPSGTEPKLKIYADVRHEPTGDLRDVETAARRDAQRLADAMADQLGL